MPDTLEGFHRGLERLWQVSRDPFVICDLDGRWLDASPRWTEILGWTRDELLGRTSAWMQHPEDRHDTNRKLHDIAGGEHLAGFTNRYIGKDGRYRAFSWTAAAHDDRLFCVARDVTDDREQAEALRLYDNIVQSDNAPICAFDTSCRLIAFNRAHSDGFFRIYGHRVRIGETFPDLFLPEQGAVIRSFMERALAGEAFTVTEEFGDPDRAMPYWEVAYNPLRDANGRVIGAFHHAVDISEKLRAQAELANTQEALRQAQKMEAVGQLTSGVAHDFNNLLMGIMGNLEILQKRIETGRTEALAKYVESAQGAARRAASLTQRLLAFSRKQAIDPKPTNVNALTAGLLEMLQRTVGPSASVDLEAAPRAWTTCVDAGQMESAILNLCINARDAMPGGGAITIRTANATVSRRTGAVLNLPTGEYVAVSVSDEGTGMTAEQVERAFEPFFTSKPAGKGTGLGLSMVYGFAKQSGGQVQISSALGQGTTVSIYLPRYRGPARADEREEPSGPGAAGDGRSVLLVEDEAEIRTLLTELLEQAGYRVHGAADGQAALRKIQSGLSPGLLITDVGLPDGMDGRKLAAAARQERPGLRVLFITGFAEDASTEAEAQRGRTETLTKPFTLDALTTRVAAMLGYDDKGDDDR